MNNLTSKIKKRVDYIDIARGITILLMVIGHILGSGLKKDLIYSYHMPFFIIISGFFFIKDEQPIVFIKKNILKLLVPTLICILLVNIYYGIFIQNNNLFSVLLDTLKQILVSYTFSNKIDLSWTMPLGVIWFLPYLLVTKTIFYINTKILKNDLACLLLIILETYIGYVLGTKGYYLPFSFDIALASMFFFYIGYIINKKVLMERILNDRIILLLCVCIWIIGVKFGVVELATRDYSNGFFSMLTAICGTIIILKISKILHDKFKNLNKPLIWYGKMSMYILVFHYLETCIIPYSAFIRIENTMLLKAVIITIKVCLVTVCTYLYIKLKSILKKHIRNKKIKVEVNK